MSRHTPRLTRLETLWRVALVQRLAVQVAAEYGLPVEELLAEAHAVLEEAARTPRTAPGSQGVCGLQWPNVYVK